MPSQAFLKRLEAASSTPRIKFSFDSTDYSGYVRAISPIRRGVDITAGTCTVTLGNENREWNRFLSNLPDLAKTATIDLYFTQDDSETYRLYTGTVTKAPLIGTNAVLHLQDKMYAMLEKRPGNGEVTVGMDAWQDNPASFAWRLLTATDGGALDDTESTSNTDIDYTSWQNWETWVNGQSFIFKGRFAGETIRQILQALAELTNSRIWVSKDGKFKFAQPYTTGILHFSREHCLKIDAIPERSMILNDVSCYYGYKRKSGEFTSYVQATNSGSQTSYGLRTHVNNLRYVYHTQEASATSYATNKITEYKDPWILVDMKTDMYGLTTDICNIELVTERFKNLNGTSIRIEEITTNLNHESNDWSVDLLCKVV